jgi:hypothetical protein
MFMSGFIASFGLRANARKGGRENYLLRKTQGMLRGGHRSLALGL